MLDESEIPELLLWLTVAELSLAALFVGARVWSARARVGATLAVERAGRFTRWTLLALIVALALALIAGDTELPRAPAWIALALSAGIALLQPAAGDSIYGERGVRRGWLARSFGELEEWRLTGEHLRWRLGDEWLACRVPAQMQAALRAKLAATRPEREATFKS